MSKKTQKKVEETPENKALTASINAVYQKYGTNLTAFYRDVRDGLTKTSKTSDSRQPPKQEENEKEKALPQEKTGAAGA